MPLRLIAPLALAFLCSACGSAPPYQGMEAIDLHELGQRQYNAEDYDEAARALERLFIAFPSYERTPDARLLLANVYFDDEQFITASSEFRRFVDRYPGHPLAPTAALGLCRASVATSPDIQRDQSATEDAEIVCGNVAADYPGTAEAAEAARMSGEMRLKIAEKLHTIADYYFRRKFFDSAIIYWQMVETQYAETTWAPTSLLGILRAYQAIGYEDLVQEARQKILTSYPASPEARILEGEAPAPPNGTSR